MMRNKQLESQHHPYQSAELTVIWRTPLGPMTGRITGQGIRELRFPPAGAQTLDAGSAAVEIVEMNDDAVGPAQPRQAAFQIAAGVTEFLRQFFDGRPRLQYPPLDLNGAGDFDRAVWEAARSIPRGKTWTYGQLARQLGMPSAARAVGGALGRNPLVLLVPCHRVIATAVGARACGGFTGGLPLKRYLLALEGVEL